MECENCGDESESEICPTCQHEQAEEDRLNEEAKSAHEFRMTDDPIYRDDFNRRMRQRREMEWGDE